MNADKIKQVPDASRRLDNALAQGLVRPGTRFLYTLNGSGACHEGTLFEISQEGHVRLDDSGIWQWPPEILIEELLYVPEPVGATPSAPPPSTETPAVQAPPPLPSAHQPPSTKPPSHERPRPLRPRH